MSTIFEASLRENSGQQGALSKLRAEGRVPGVVYGGTKAPQNVDVCVKVLTKALRDRSFRNHIHTLQLGEKDSQQVFVRAMDFHPVKDTPIHVDFMRVVKGARTVLSIPLVFTDEEACPGLKRGGLLNTVVHAIEVSAPADAIPDEFVISLKGKQLGEAIHVSDLNIPTDVKVLRLGTEATIANIVAPRGEKAETETTEDAGEA